MFIQGLSWNIDMGALTFTPSFAPGLYHEGDGKDLGHALEFKSEIQFSYNFLKTLELVYLIIIYLMQV